MTITQYRVVFTELGVNGKINHSTQWYDSVSLCEKWMGQDDAKIITREYKEDSFPLPDFWAKFGL